MKRESSKPTSDTPLATPPEAAKQPTPDTPIPKTTGTPSAPALASPEETTCGSTAKPSGSPTEPSGQRATRTAADSIRTWRQRGASSRKGKTLVWLRRGSQAFFLLLFLFLLVRTEFRTSYSIPSESGSQPVLQIDQPVGLFLEIDPLVAVSTTLSTHSLRTNLLIALVVILPTLLMGRFFCGWICPLGTLNHWVSEIRPRPKGASRIDKNRYRPYLRLKYYLLVGMLAAALLTSLQVGLLDPICLLIRSMGLAVIPAVDWLMQGALRLVEGTGVGFLQSLADWGQGLRMDWVTAKNPVVYGAWFLGFLFLAILVLNRVITRFWCRGLCPLGALLGLLSRFAIFGMYKDHERCTSCGLCQLHCQGADEPQGGVQWRSSECHLCFNCEGTCPEGVIRFGWFPRRHDVKHSVDLTRRSLVTSMAGGLAFVPLARTTAGSDADSHPKRIRPPGSLAEREFLERCIKCGECMKVCPNNALHPALTQAGLEGLFSPVVINRIGYCEASCTLCSQVCPTGAIAPIGPEQRLAEDPERRIRIGTAFFDRGRCLPWAMDTPCIVCEEWCPVSPKAIWLEEVAVHPRNQGEGGELHLRRPHLDPLYCIGCGACEHACPVADSPAVYVTAIGESRDPDRALLLRSRVLPEDPT
ncbi:MAG: 4Fe-4S dicluster domain-containing protein [Bradymonadales bacterium]|nr:4Fe-4S dicluster domain-containing protein [Bradymonadales bacterium]